MYSVSLVNSTRTGALKKTLSGLWVTVTRFHISPDYPQDNEVLAIHFYLYFLTTKPRCQVESLLSADFYYNLNINCQTEHKSLISTNDAKVNFANVGFYPNCFNFGLWSCSFEE